MKQSKILLVLLLILVIAYFLFASKKPEGNQEPPKLVESSVKDEIKDPEEVINSEVDLPEAETKENLEEPSANLQEVKKFKDLKLERYLKTETDLALSRGVITEEQIEAFQQERKAIYTQEQARKEQENTEFLGE